MTAATRPKGPDWGGVALAVGILVLTAIASIATTSITSEAGYARVSPQVVPIGIDIALGVCGLLLLVQALRGGWLADQEEFEAQARRETSWWSLVWVSAGLLLQAAILDIAGFVLSTALLFVLVARGFGSRRPWIDVPLGLGLAVLTYILFTQALSLTLPAGLLEGII